MGKKRFDDIIRFASAQKSLPKQVSYFIRGLIFGPFILKMSRKTVEEGESVASTSQVGDDIYPLF